VALTWEIGRGDRRLFNKTIPVVAIKKKKEIGFDLKQKKAYGGEVRDRVPKREGHGKEGVKKFKDTRSRRLDSRRTLTSSSRPIRQETSRRAVQDHA